MKTLAELKAFCEKNNVRYEINPYSVSEHYNVLTGEWEKIIIGYYFGMNNIAGKGGKSEWNWTWFICFCDKLTDETVFYFEDRYSMVNGKSYKGWREEVRANERIERGLKN